MNPSNRQDTPKAHVKIHQVDRTGWERPKYLVAVYIDGEYEDTYTFTKWGARYSARKIIREARKAARRRRYKPSVVEEYDL